MAVKVQLSRDFASCAVRKNGDATFSLLNMAERPRRVSPVVVQLQRTPEGRLLQSCDVYIDHAWSRQGWSLPESPWASPFPGKHAAALAQYEQHVRTQRWSQLSTLEGQVLGCWCRIPEDQAVCHGLVLVRLWREQFPDYEVQADLGRRLYATEASTILPEPPGSAIAASGKKRKGPPPNEKPPPPSKPAHRIRTQLTHPLGFTKAGQRIPWPVIDHEWNATTLWIDEAGMGCWAGPLHVAGTVLLPGFRVLGLIDSKLLDAHERDTAYAGLQQALADHQLLAHVETVSNTEVDRLKLGGAWKAAIRRVICAVQAQAAARGLTLTRVVLDGNKTVADTALPITALPKADRLYAGVAAAAILAKVSRDRFMTAIAPRYPEFQKIFDEGSGYHHSQHHKDLLQAGKHTDLHRQSFDPLRSILQSRVTVVRAGTPPPPKVYRLLPTTE